MSKQVDQYVRETIKRLIPYSSARSEFEGKNGIFLDANENPYGSYNRYPDPFQWDLKRKLAEVKGVRPTQVFLNNGSDGIVDMCYRVFCDPGIDKALTFHPSFGMYTVAAGLNNVELIKLPFDDDFQIVQEDLEPYLSDKSIKMIMLCSPNNPTGNHMRMEDIDYVLDNFEGIVILDEAYIDFAERPSYLSKLDQYPQLVILQTFSKAYALAGARIGIAYMNEILVTYFNKVKTPYNLSTITQEIAIDALTNKQEEFKENLSRILSEKRRVQKALEEAKIIKKVYPSDTNFFFVEVEDGDDFYEKLVQHHIVVRNQNKVWKNCLRITVGNPDENTAFIKALEELSK